MADQHGCRRASAAPRLWKLTPARLLQLSVLAMALQEGSRAANHAHVPLPRRGSMLSAVDLIEQELYGEPVSSDGKSRGDAPPPRVPRHPRRPTLRDPARCRTRKSKEGVKESETRQERERKSKAKSKARRETRRATAKKDERKGRRAEGGFGDWRFQQECFDPEERSQTHEQHPLTTPCRLEHIPSPALGRCHTTLVCVGMSTLLPTHAHVLDLWRLTDLVGPRAACAGSRARRRRRTMTRRAQ